jgi:hypothetical protein
MNLFGTVRVCGGILSEVHTGGIVHFTGGFMRTVGGFLLKIDGFMRTVGGFLLKVGGSIQRSKWGKKFKKKLVKKSKRQ